MKGLQLIVCKNVHGHKDGLNISTSIVGVYRTGKAFDSATNLVNRLLEGL